jgi:predicted RNase H-like HicB family nuclease
VIRYPALIDGDAGAYGVVFPDIPGVGAMGYTVDEALLNAEEVLRDYAIETEKDGEQLATPSPFYSIETPTGNQLVSIPLIRLSGKRVRAGLTLEEGVAELIDSEAR